MPAPALSVAALLLALSIALSPQAARSQSDTTIGIDANPADNSATVLGARDSCISVRQGDSFQVDVIVQDATDLLAWEAYLSFDPDHLHVTGRDVQRFLASIPESSAFDISEVVPDDDGRYRVGAANIADPPKGGSGAGVLARLTLEAQEPGMASLSLAPIETDMGMVGATLTATDGSPIGDSNDDGLFDGSTLEAQVAIDEACPGGGSSANPEDEGDGGGSVWWVLLAVAAGAAGILGISAALLIARRRAGAR